MIFSKTDTKVKVCNSFGKYHEMISNNGEALSQNSLFQMHSAFWLLELLSQVFDNGDTVCETASVYEAHYSSLVFEKLKLGVHQDEDKAKISLR